MAKIFVSYSRKDSESARKLVAALEELGLDVWVDWEEIAPAVDWLENIKRGIEEADAFVFLVSPDSIKSEVCNVEIGHAAANNKRIVPVMLREVQIGDTNAIIQKYNFIFLRSEDNFETGIADIKEAIEVDFAWVVEHSLLQARALEWDRKKDSGLLLRGRELRRVRRTVGSASGKEPAPTDLQNMYVKHGVQSETRRTIIWVLTTVTLIIMVGLFLFANTQRIQADENRAEAEAQAVIALKNEEEAKAQRALAEENQKLAEENAQTAKENAEAADLARQDAEDQKKIAQAQRSAARAQIYQIQPDDLYTSTLLAIASSKTFPTDEANEILRKNISLLPIPVKQMFQEGGINSLEFNTQRDLFVTGGGDGKACVWKVSDGELLNCSTSPTSVNDAVFSPDGEYLVTGDSSGEVQIIRISDWNVVHTFSTGGAIVWDIDISANGENIAVTRDDSRISIVELEIGEENYPLFVTGKIQFASFSPNGRYIASGSSAGVVTIWNLGTNANPVTNRKHTGGVLTLAFSPDSRYLVTGGEDGYAVVTQTSTGRELYKLLHEDAVTDIAFNPDGGKWFATVSNDRRIRLWDTATGNERIRMSQNSFVDAVDVSANGQWLATTGADRTVRVWNASTGTQMFQIPIANEGTVLGFGEASNSLVAGDRNGNINLWDISVMPTPEYYLQFGNPVGDMQFSPSGEWLAASSGNRVWLLRSEQLSTLTTAPTSSLNIAVTGNVISLAFSPDSNWLGISTDEGNVLVYNLSTKVYKTFIASGVDHDIAFSSDNAYLVISQPGGSIDAWDLKNGDQTVAYVGGGLVVESLAIGASRIALGVENEILLLNGSGERMFSIESPGDHTLLLFSADESMLASTNSEGNIEVWKLESETAIPVGSIRKETVYSMAFNPAGTKLAVGTTNTVYLIDPTTVEETARIPHADIVTAISYSADGNVMATSSLKAVQFWDVAKIKAIRASNLVDEACNRLTANFSQSQWNNLFGGEEYQVLCENLPVP